MSLRMSRKKGKGGMVLLCAVSSLDLAFALLLHSEGSGSALDVAF